MTSRGNGNFFRLDHLRNLKAWGSAPRGWVFYLIDTVERDAYSDEIRVKFTRDGAFRDQHQL